MNIQWHHLCSRIDVIEDHQYVIPWSFLHCHISSFSPSSSPCPSAYKSIVLHLCQVLGACVFRGVSCFFLFFVQVVLNCFFVFSWFVHVFIVSFRCFHKSFAKIRSTNSCFLMCSCFLRGVQLTFVFRHVLSCVFLDVSCFFMDFSCLLMFSLFFMFL